ncbi:MAG: thiolase family protein [Candidatus Helarchaeota archaeon]
MFNVAIVGYGAIPIGKYPKEHETELAVEAISKALENANMEKKDLHGLITTPNYTNTIEMQTSLVQEAMNLPSKVACSVGCGGVAGGLALKYALYEIQMGFVDTICCYSSDREYSLGNRLLEILHEKEKGSSIFDPIDQPYCPVGFIWGYALSARRYMHEYGATEEDFALAVARDSQNAQKNPYSAFHTPLTVEDVLNSKVISSPLKLLDISAMRDGAAAIILTRKENAKKYTDIPLEIKGYGEYHDNSCFVSHYTEKSIIEFPASRESAKQAYKMAKITPSEIDFAEIYAPFSSHELMIPEGLGFFKKGEMIKAIREGETEIGGKIPINTDGGLLGRGHPAWVTSIYEIISVIRQLRGENQNIVDGAELGLFQAEGGMLNNCFTAIIAR